MGIRFSNLIGVMALAASSVGFIPAAMAGEDSLYFVAPVSPQPTGIQDVFNPPLMDGDDNFSRAFFGGGMLQRQVQSLFGLPNSFPEIQIGRNAQQVYELYKRVFNRQVTDGPILRTPDLPSPYTTSIRQLQIYNARPVVGGEIVEQELPPR